MHEEYTGKPVNRPAASAFPEIQERLGLLEHVGDVMWKLFKGLTVLRSRDEAEDTYKRVCVFFLIKAAKTHRAIEHLVGAGFLQDARALLRCLAELVITLRHIRADTKSRALLYAEHAYVAKWRWVQSAKKVEEFRRVRLPEHESKAEELKKRYEGVRARYPKQTWSGLSVAKMAKQTGMKAEYVFYKWDCDYVHSGARTAQEYLKVSEDGGLTITPWPQGATEFPGTIMMTCRYSYEVAETFRKLFDAELKSRPEVIAEIDSEFDRIRAEVSRLRDA